MTKVWSVALGAILAVSVATARPTAAFAQRNDRCRYQSLDGQHGFSTGEVKRTIECATHRFGVDTGYALYIANRESHLSAYAQNPSGACGIFQHMPAYWPGRVWTFQQRHPFWRLRDSCFNARSNVLVAVDMMAHYGFGAWGG